jgi:hypothetical protein
MQTIDPALATALVAMSAALLMIHAGIAKRRLAWRTRSAIRKRRRRS